MDQGGSKDSYQTFKGPWFNSQIAQLNTVKKLDAKNKPHDKHQPEGNYRTTKKTTLS